MTVRRAFRGAAAAGWVLLLAVLSGCAGARAIPPAPALSGRVTFRGAPVAGAVVTLYDRYGSADSRAIAAARCGDDGGFRIDVPPGTYFIAAEGAFEGTAVFAFSGRNPVRIESGERWLGMKTVPKEEAASSPGPPERGAVVEGAVLSGGVPVEGATVIVYASADSQFKGMGIAMSPPTGADGTFAIENLPESSYFLVARRRAGGEMTGPLEKGDLYGYYSGNPVYARGGRVTRVRIETVEKEKPLSYAEVTAGTETVLRGRVVDRSGAPQAGVYAFVYDDRVFGHQRPFGHSGRTGPDGTFAIYLDRPGTFYLGARENFGNSPRPGERFGFYEGTPDHAIEAVPGRTADGLVIVVDRILPEGR